AIMVRLSENKWLGDKTGQGFYKKIKDEKGKSVILGLDFATMEYKPSDKKVKFATLETTKPVTELSKRFPLLVKGTDKAGESYRKTFADSFRYATCRIPEIAGELFRIDQAITAGFGSQMGIFETWDAIGVKEMLSIMEDLDLSPAPWVY